MDVIKPKNPNNYVIGLVLSLGLKINKPLIRHQAEDSAENILVN